MIARLRGIILEKKPNAAVVDVGGVGYALTIPISTFSSLPNVGDEAALHVHTHVREDASTIEEVYEPYLMQLGFLDRTPRGRVGTQLAFEYFKLSPPSRGQLGLEL